MGNRYRSKKDPNNASRGGRKVPAERRNQYLKIFVATELVPHCRRRSIGASRYAIHSKVDERPGRRRSASAVSWAICWASQVSYSPSAAGRSPPHRAARREFHRCLPEGRPTTAGGEADVHACRMPRGLAGGGLANASDRTISSASWIAARVEVGTLAPCT